MADCSSNSHNGRVRTPAFAWIILACLGVVDLVRGFMHTVLVQYAAVHIAGLNLAESGQDQLMLLGSFGISNLLTGAIFIAVAFKAKPLVPTVLALIPLAYFLGLIAVRLQVTPQAPFPGRTFMYLYLAICTFTFVASVVCMRRNRDQ